MSLELKKYIREQRESGVSTVRIVEELKKTGWDETAIDGALNDTFATAETRQKNKPHHFSATTALTLIGTILILIATIIIVSTTWADVSPATRIIYLALPMAILYVVSYLTEQKDQLESVHFLTGFAGTAMIPFVVGTFFYQTNIIDDISPLLFVVSAGIGLVFDLLLEFFLKRDKYAILSIISLYVFAGATLFYLDDKIVTDKVILWTFALLSMIVTFAGNFLLKKRPSDAKIFFLLGLATSAFSLPAATVSLFDHSLSVSATTNSVINSLFSILYLATASRLYRLSIQAKQPLYYLAKRFLEEYSVILIVLSLANFSSNGLILAIALVISVIFILASTRIKIVLMPIMGILGLITSIFNLTDKYFQNSISWPLTVIVLGFITIGLGVLAKKLSGEKHAATPYLGLGKDETVEDKGKRSMFWTIFLTAISLYFIANIIIVILAFAIFSNFN